jgi:hypothetical protein
LVIGSDSTGPETLRYLSPIYRIDNYDFLCLISLRLMVKDLRAPVPTSIANIVWNV